MNIKLVKICFIATLLLIAGGTAKAVLTTDLYLDDPDHTLDRTFDVSGDWTHTFDTIPSVGAITAATLDLRAKGNYLDDNSVALDGVDLGDLYYGGDSQTWYLTQFDLMSNSSALAELLDGSATIDLTVAQSLKLDWSRITIEYEEGSTTPPEEPPPTEPKIPAPGSILLGGIGAGLVGWLRRRRSL